MFFDLDNTLWDHRANSEKALKSIFEEQEITQRFDLSFDEWHPVFYEKNEVLWALLRDKEINKDQLRERRFTKPFAFFDIDEPELCQFFDAEYLERMKHQTGLVEGAVQLLDFLKPNHILHIITNGFEEVSTHKVENSALKGYFTTLTCADEINVRKPDPKIFDHALNKAGAAKEDSLLIGDDLVADIVGAIEYGMDTIFLNVFDEHFTFENVPQVKKLEEIKPYFQP